MTDDMRERKLDRRGARAGRVGGMGLGLCLLSPAAIFSDMGAAAFASVLMCGMGALMWTTGEVFALRRAESAGR